MNKIDIWLVLSFWGIYIVIWAMKKLIRLIIRVRQGRNKDETDNLYTR